MKTFIVYHDEYDDEGVEINAIDEEDAVEKLAKDHYYSYHRCDPEKYNFVARCNGKTYTVSAWTDINFCVTDDGEV